MTDFATSAAGRIEGALIAVGRPERAQHERAYLKSDLRFLGASIPEIRAVVRDCLGTRPDLDRCDLLALVQALWARPVHEFRMAAVVVLVSRSDLLTSRDLPLLELFLRQSGTWALVDPLAASVVSVLAERDAHAVGAVLDRWASDPDFWLRRSALLALLPPLRRGGGDVERFTRYADGLLEDPEPFIRKAIGWVLREMSLRRPDLVRDWLLPRAQLASGVTFAEAVKHLPEAERQVLEQARRSARPEGHPGRSLRPAPAHV